MKERRNDSGVGNSHRANRELGFQSLDEALHVLDEAAQKSGREVKRMILSDFQHIQDAISEITPEIQKAMHLLGDEARAFLETAGKSISTVALSGAKEMDRRIHRNPWMFVTAATISGIAVGYYLSQREKVTYVGDH